MPLRTAQQQVKSSLGWEYQTTTTGFASTRQKDNVTFSAQPDASVYNFLFAKQYTITAGCSQTVDLFAFTVDFTGEQVVGGTVIAGAIRATAAATGGYLRIEPGTTNPFGWLLHGTAPYILKSVPVSPASCGVEDLEDVNNGGYSLSGVCRNLLISNPGTVSITVKMAFLMTGALLQEPPPPLAVIVQQETPPWMFGGGGVIVGGPVVG